MVNGTEPPGLTVRTAPGAPGESAGGDAILVQAPNGRAMR